MGIGSICVGRQTDGKQINSLTGEPFVLVRDEKSISVWGAAIDGSDAPVTIRR